MINQVYKLNNVVFIFKDNVSFHFDYIVLKVITFFNGKQYEVSLKQLKKHLFLKRGKNFDVVYLKTY